MFYYIIKPIRLRFLIHIYSIILLKMKIPINETMSPLNMFLKASPKGNFNPQFNILILILITRFYNSLLHLHNPVKKWLDVTKDMTKGLFHEIL